MSDSNIVHVYMRTGISTETFVKDTGISIRHIRPDVSYFWSPANIRTSERERNPPRIEPPTL